MKTDLTYADLQRLHGALDLSYGEIGEIFGVPALEGAETPGAAAAASAGGGDGGDGGGDGYQPSELYTSVLQGMPEELRPYGEKALREWDKQVNPRLQEAAQIRQKYEPYEAIDGFSDLDPQELASLVQIRNILGDPEQAKKWAGQLNQALGLSTVDGLDEDAWAALGDQNGWFDGSGPEGEEGNVLEQVAAMLDERLGPIQQHLTTQEQQAQHAATVQQIQERMQGQMEQVLEQLGEMDPERSQQVQKWIIEHAYAYPNDEDAILKAFASYQQITGQAVGDVAERRLAQPRNGALSGGQPSTEPKRLSWNGGEGVSPREAALARLRA